MTPLQARSGLAALAFVAVGAVLYLLLFRAAIAPQELTIATGSPGGTYIKLGSTLARILDDVPTGPIARARALPTGGSIENIELLTSGRVDIGLSPRTSLVLLSPEQRGRLRVLADLYRDVVQVMVRHEAGVHRLRDLAGKRVYVGRDGSGLVPLATGILNHVGVDVTPSTRAGTSSDAFSAASLKLQQGVVDAAFVLAGTPTTAVTAAMTSGCCALLDLAPDIETLSTIEQFRPHVSNVTLPAYFYPNQTEPIRTVSTRAQLISRADLTDEVAGRVVEALYDNVRDLLRVLTKEEDIEFRMPQGSVVDLHGGVAQYWEERRGMLQIVTGTIDGIYYSTGKAIQRLLEQRGIESSVVHTQGSLENLERLAAGNTIALMQHEVALAAYWGGDSGPVYGLSYAIPDVSGVRRIATLRPEVMHAVVRRDRPHPIRSASRSVSGWIGHALSARLY